MPICECAGARFSDCINLAGTHHDADKLGFLIATVELALKRADLGDDFREYLRSLKL